MTLQRFTLILISVLVSGCSRLHPETASTIIEMPPYKNCNEIKDECGERMFWFQPYSFSQPDLPGFCVGDARFHGLTCKENAKRKRRERRLK